MRHAGVISDTHGLLRPQALAALRGSALIIHAGDVGNPEILAALGEIAPVFAVRGNVDRGSWTKALPPRQVVEFEQNLIYVLHDLYELDLDPVAAGLHAVICGHSHRPQIERKEDVLYFNPGSAGPRRFDLPITVGRLTITGGKLEAEIIDLGSW
jgi:putative phosphoesterase